MIGIAFRTVDVHTAGTRDQGFVGIPDEFGEICRQLAAADNIRMDLEIDNTDLRSVFPLNDQQGTAVIGGTCRAVDIRVLIAGIGAERAVLHSEAADKGYVLCFSTGVGELCRSQVLNCQNGGIS